ncbi:DUF3667 domain-containing protein [Sphingomonas sp.]|uniref:DUF3667 domain-containing protein n=1 Tax=Sphingomonas sp. TaxID=28214 RepID=UPI001EB8BF27|nr:DUF3667 domain-containing protein [Sphingomonas sp.]MBX3594978.1 DUF3667 domain-containing protein [Sphingomonas sp.]
MGEFDAAGDIVTGGLVARAIDGGHGAGHDGGGPGALCLNCGTVLVGPHCHRCGQPAHVHRTIGAIWHEILHGVVHFEGRLWNTLPLLVFRPGELTRRYIHGERAHFVSPMAMFLFAVFTMFAVLQIGGISPPAEIGTQAQFRQGMELAIKQSETALAEARQARSAAPPESDKARKLDARIGELERSLAGLRNVPATAMRPQGSMFGFKTGWNRLDHGIEKAEKNPGLALYKLQTNSYKFSWALIPLSIPFIWLLFAWKRQYRGYDHAVFVTYSLAFVSLLFIAITIAGGLGVGSDWLGLAAMLVPPVHIFFQMKGAYRLRWWSALLRTLVLLWFITIIAVLFALLLLGLGLLG